MGTEAGACPRATAAGLALDERIDWPASSFELRTSPGAVEVVQFDSASAQHDRVHMTGFKRSRCPA